MGPFKSAGLSRTPTLLPRLKTQTAPGDCGRRWPQAANTLSCQAHVAVIISGVCGRVKKIRFRPRRRSYVCSECPTEVVIWKVDLPKRTDVNGTGVGDTSPSVFKNGQFERKGSSQGQYQLTRKGAKILEPRVPALTPCDARFCLFARGRSKLSLAKAGILILRSTLGPTK